jgi:beta-galactosidase
VAYSNCAAVELFLNGRSLGKKDMPRLSHLEWKVKYAPGKLEARGYKNGMVVATNSVETTGAPGKLVLTTERTSLNADGEDAAVINVSAVDAQGRTVPTANNLVKFEISGAKISGVGNGDSSCHESDKGSVRSLFNGFAQVIVQATRQTGTMTLTARSEGLASAAVTIPVQRAGERSCLP